MHSNNAVNSLVHLLHRAGQQADDLFARSTKLSGITARQFAILASVSHIDQPNQTVLCECTGIDRSTTADIVRRLVARRLLSRRRTRGDARAYAVELTPEGRRVLENAQQVSDLVDAEILAVLAPDDQAHFTSMLRSIAGRELTPSLSGEVMEEAPRDLQLA